MDGLMFWHVSHSSLATPCPTRSLHCFELPHQPVWKVSKYSIPTVWITTADLQARLTRLAGLQDGSDGLTEAINKRS